MNNIEVKRGSLVTTISMKKDSRNYCYHIRYSSNRIPISTCYQISSTNRTTVTP